jgi:hypothetical protein
MAIGPAAGDDASVDVPRPSFDVSFALRIACERLFASEATFLAHFATSLTGLVPQLAALPDRGRALADGLGRAVLWAALTDDPVEVVEATFQNIGADYAHRGFPTDGYHGAGHALLRAARDTYSGDWSSELSSGWVAYFAWLGAHLTQGARTVAAPSPAPAPPTPPPPPPMARPPAQAEPPEHRAPAAAAPPGPPAGGSRPGQGGPTLDDVLTALRGRYFPVDNRDLRTVLTRVALRTGADLRAPLPDQRTDPATVAAALAALYAMGFGLHPDGTGPADSVFPGTASGDAVGRVGGYV